MAVLMGVVGRILGNLYPMAAMMFPNGGDLGLGVRGMMVVPAVEFALTNCCFGALDAKYIDETFLDLFR